MKQEVKEKWVAALRSGEFKQGFYVLAEKTFNETQYCVLGVLCEIAFREGITAKETDDLIYDIYDGQDCDLPESVMQWAELESPESIADAFLLTTFNDKLRKSFNELADIIERYL